jgi:hypothetical protein
MNAWRDTSMKLRLSAIALAVALVAATGTNSTIKSGESGSSKVDPVRCAAIGGIAGGGKGAGIGALGGGVAGLVCDLAKRNKQ